MIKSLLIILLLATALFAQPGGGIAVPAGCFLYGVFPGSWNATEKDVTLATYNDFVQAVGKKPHFVGFSHEWAKGVAFPDSTFRWIDSVGAVPFCWLSIRSRVGLSWQADPVYTNRAIAEGKFDAQLVAWALHAKKFGKTIWAKWGTECNGGVMPWSGCYNGGAKTNGYGDPKLADGPESFRDAYRHIIDVMRRAGAINIRWIFHCVGYSGPHEQWNKMAAYYPGDSYIDAIGTSDYGPKGSTSPCTPSAREACYAYPQMAALSPTKPLMFCELATGTTNPKCNAEAWTDSAFTQMQRGWMRQPYGDSLIVQTPRYRIFSWWNEGGVTASGDTIDYRVQHDAGLQRSFHRGVRDKKNVIGGYR